MILRCAFAFLLRASARVDEWLRWRAQVGKYSAVSVTGGRWRRRAVAARK